MTQATAPELRDIASISLAEDYWKARFEAGALPTTREIHHMLDAIIYAPTRHEPTECDATILPSIVTDPKYHKDIDNLLVFLISNLKKDVGSHDLKLFLDNAPSASGTFVERAAQLCLVETLKYLIKCGASSGDRATAAVVYRSRRVPDGSSRRFRANYSRAQKSIRKLLDRSICAATRGEICGNYSYHIDKGGSLRMWNAAISVDFMEEEMRVWHNRNSAEIHRMWIHISSGNALDLEAMVEWIDEESLVWFQKTLRSSIVAPGDTLLNYREVGYWSGRSQPGGTLQSAIVFPCLELTTLRQHRARRDAYKAFRGLVTTRSDGAYASECRAYTERTLDETYFPGLDANQLSIRNKDQIVSFYVMKGPTDKDHDTPILIVPQLWIWRFGDLLMSAHGTEIEIIEKLAPSNQVSATIASIMAIYIKRFGEELVIDDGKRVPPTLDLFESRVVSILSNVKAYMNNTKRNILDYDTEASFHHTLSDCRSELAMIQYVLSQQDEILHALLNDEDASQTTPMPKGKDTGHAALKKVLPIEGHRDQVEKSLAMIKKYQERVKKIDGDAERIEKNVQDLLNLKRTYASVQDSHASVLLSAAAIGFAIVTIIFTPLAFLSALFALDLQGFDRLRLKQNDESGSDATPTDPGVSPGSDKDPAFDSGKIAGIFVTTEILTIAVTGLLVWASLRWFGIEINDLRPKSENQKPEPEMEEVVIDETEEKGIRMYLNRLKWRGGQRERRLQV